MKAIYLKAINGECYYKKKSKKVLRIVNYSFHKEISYQNLEATSLDDTHTISDEEFDIVYKRVLKSLIQ